MSPDTYVPDPLDPQALNRYAYALNNPLRYNDPTGHCYSGCGGCGPSGGQPEGPPLSPPPAPPRRIIIAPVVVTPDPEPPSGVPDFPPVVVPQPLFPPGIVPPLPGPGSLPFVQTVQYKRFENGNCVNQGCNFDVIFEPTPAEITPNRGRPEPYAVKGTVQLTPDASIQGQVFVAAWGSNGVPVAIYGESSGERILPDTPLAPPFSFIGSVSGQHTSYFMFTVMDVHGNPYGTQTRWVNYGDVPLY